MTTVCINGSRDFNNFERLENELLLRLPIDEDRALEIVSGGARGADRLVSRFCQKYQIQFTEFPANWQKYGKEAGFIRNRIMVDYSERLISFWDGKSRGTKDTIDYAMRKGKPVEIINVSTF